MTNVTLRIINGKVCARMLLINIGMYYSCTEAAQALCDDNSMENLFRDESVVAEEPCRIVCTNT